LFGKLAKDHIGQHAVDRNGQGHERTYETKPYEYGDPFLLDLKETLMNAVERRGAGTPVRLVPDDFEVFRTELLTQSATVVMLDLSRSMIYNGCFMPAKKVALALHALIRGQRFEVKLRARPIGAERCVYDIVLDLRSGANDDDFILEKGAVTVATR
jgi:uncharacterized protein with von Willebrand factor type A (vWA) domain